MNLTAIEEPTEVAYKHFVDSACLLRVMPELKNKSMIDIGTGAGFPGVPLKIMEPALSLTLFDSLNKRIVFLQEVCKQLGLEGVQAIHGRAEEFGIKPEYRAQYDLATAQSRSADAGAVGNLSAICEKRWHLYCTERAGTGK